VTFELGYSSSDEVLEDLARYEPLSVQGQAPIVWDKAEGEYVFDMSGKRYLDWSSGVLVANVGHGNPEIVEAVNATASKPLLFSYSFPTAERAALLREMAALLPREDDKILLLSTGSEAIEVALKLSLEAARRSSDGRRKYVVSFERAFHGRTMGAQLSGGIPALKEWITCAAGSFAQIPFPDGFRTEQTDFADYEAVLAEQGVTGEEVACVMIESYQGGGASFAPAEYMQALSKWCADNGAVLIMDEVQAGFGRTGRWFAYEHYGITPDLVALGKGLSSSLPVSALIGRRDLLDQYSPGAMSSTHGGHPVCSAAALANLRAMRENRVVENAEETGAYLAEALDSLAEEHAYIGAVHGAGMVYGLHIVEPGTKEPDAAVAARIVERCVRDGLMLFAPVGFGGATVKICPPLTMSCGQVDEGMRVLSAACAEEEV
jgi:4-aminobutyrate aminotransferase-like enzyme